MEWNQIKLIGIIAYLAFISVIDVRKKKIPIWILGIILLCGGLHQILHFSNFLMLIYDLLPGLVFLVIARITSQQIGYGDGLLVLGIGLLMGIQRNMLILIFALGISFFIAMILLCTKKGNRKTQIPFFPCYFIGFLLQSWMMGW